MLEKALLSVMKPATEVKDVSLRTSITHEIEKLIRKYPNAGIPRDITTNCSVKES